MMGQLRRLVNMGILIWGCVFCTTTCTTTEQSSWESQGLVITDKRTFALPPYAPYWLDDQMHAAVNYWNKLHGSSLFSVTSFDSADVAIDYSFASSISSMIVDKDNKGNPCAKASPCRLVLMIPAPDLLERMVSDPHAIYAVNAAVKESNLDESFGVQTMGYATTARQMQKQVTALRLRALVGEVLKKPIHQND